MQANFLCVQQTTIPIFAFPLVRLVLFFGLLPLRQAAAAQAPAPGLLPQGLLLRRHNQGREAEKKDCLRSRFHLSGCALILRFYPEFREVLRKRLGYPDDGPSKFRRNRPPVQPASRDRRKRVLRRPV